MAAYIFDRFPAAVRAMAARCKLSFAIRPGLSQEDRRRPKEMTKERQEGNTLHSHSSSADARKAGVGRNRGSSTSAPSLSVSASLSSSRSLLSRTSHSDASLCASSSTGAGASLPTSVVDLGRSFNFEVRSRVISNKSGLPKSTTDLGERVSLTAYNLLVHGDICAARSHSPSAPPSSGPRRYAATPPAHT